MVFGSDCMYGFLGGCLGGYGNCIFFESYINIANVCIAELIMYQSFEHLTCNILKSVITFRTLRRVTQQSNSPFLP